MKLSHSLGLFFVVLSLAGCNLESRNPKAGGGGDKTREAQPGDLIGSSSSDKEITTAHSILGRAPRPSLVESMRPVVLTAEQILEAFQCRVPQRPTSMLSFESKTVPPPSKEAEESMKSLVAEVVQEYLDQGHCIHNKIQFFHVELGVADAFSYLQVDQVWERDSVTAVFKLPIDFSKERVRALLALGFLKVNSQSGYHLLTAPISPAHEHVETVLEKISSRFEELRSGGILLEDSSVLAAFIDNTTRNSKFKLRLRDGSITRYRLELFEWELLHPQYQSGEYTLPQARIDQLLFHGHLVSLLALPSVKIDFSEEAIWYQLAEDLTLKVTEFLNLVNSMAQSGLSQGFVFNGRTTVEKVSPPSSASEWFLQTGAQFLLSYLKFDQGGTTYFDGIDNWFWSPRGLDNGIDPKEVFRAIKLAVASAAKEVEREFPTFSGRLNLSASLLAFDSTSEEFEVKMPIESLLNSPEALKLDIKSTHPESWTIAEIKEFYNRVTTGILGSFLEQRATALPIVVCEEHCSTSESGRLKVPLGANLEKIEASLIDAIGDDVRNLEYKTGNSRYFFKLYPEGDILRDLKPDSLKQLDEIARAAVAAFNEFESLNGRWRYEPRPSEGALGILISVDKNEGVLGKKQTSPLTIDVFLNAELEQVKSAVIQNFLFQRESLPGPGDKPVTFQFGTSLVFKDANDLFSYIDQFLQHELSFRNDGYEASSVRLSDSDVINFAQPDGRCTNTRWRGSVREQRRHLSWGCTVFYLSGPGSPDQIYYMLLKMGYKFEGYSLGTSPEVDLAKLSARERFEAEVRRRNQFLTQYPDSFASSRKWDFMVIDFKRLIDQPHDLATLLKKGLELLPPVLAGEVKFYGRRANLSAQQTLECMVTVEQVLIEKLGGGDVGFRAKKREVFVREVGFSEEPDRSSRSLYLACGTKPEIAQALGKVVEFIELSEALTLMSVGADLQLGAVKFAEGKRKIEAIAKNVSDSGYRLSRSHILRLAFSPDQVFQVSLKLDKREGESCGSSWTDDGGSCSIVVSMDQFQAEPLRYLAHKKK